MPESQHVAATAGSFCLGLVAQQRQRADPAVHGCDSVAPPRQAFAPVPRPDLRLAPHQRGTAVQSGRPWPPLSESAIFPYFDPR